jgi:hypothetical protein
VTRAAEDAWITVSTGTWVRGSAECTPGYYNNEGADPPARVRLNVGYRQGPMLFFSYLRQWRVGPVRRPGVALRAG